MMLVGRKEKVVLVKCLGSFLCSLVMILLVGLWFLFSLIMMLLFCGLIVLLLL